MSDDNTCSARIHDASVVERDNEGFFLNPGDWCYCMIDQLAAELDIELSDDHRQVVFYIRDYFESNSSVPQARYLLRYLAKVWGRDKATRKYLYQLFPYGYGQQACKIAGMRKPLKLMLDV